MTRIALAAALAFAALPAAAQTGAGCTQLELSVGLRGAECGVLSLQEVAELRTIQTEM